jgi:hypothetical protein
VLGLVALMLASSASAEAPQSLASSSAWWEKVTYTMTGEGVQQSCTYESSLAGVRNCATSESSSPVRAASGGVGSYTTVTIERRFTPNGQVPEVPLQAGDTLLGGQVMALAIDEGGSVRSCRVLAASGDIRPSYSCAEARAERFEASARSHSHELRQGYMTIVVYGHEANLA